MKQKIIVPIISVIIVILGIIYIPKLKEKQEEKKYKITVFNPEHVSPLLKVRIDKMIKFEKESFISLAKKNRSKIPYELLINYEKVDYANIEHYHFIICSFLGGNHQERKDYSYYFDKTSNKEIHLDYLFKNKDFLENLSENAIIQIKDYAKNKNIKEKYINFEGLKPDLKNFQHFILDKNGLNIFIEPLQVFTWSEGEVNISISYSSLKDVINDEYIPKEYGQLEKPPIENKDDIPKESTSSYKPISDSKKYIALTFDDGPASNTDNFLNELNNTNAKVTFFVLGSRARQYPDTIKRQFDNGHQICSHSYSHVNFTRVSQNIVDNEIIKTKELLNTITGSYYNCLRPPYGSFNKKLQSSVKEHVILWNVDILDWKYRSENRVYDQIVKNVYDGAIFVLHDIYQSTTNGVIKAIKKLESEGYVFVTIDELAKIKGVTLKPGVVYRNLR